MSQEYSEHELQLEGQFLISMPGIGDPRFERSLIYLCAHSASGAMGFIVNHAVESTDFLALLKQLEIRNENSIANLSPEVSSLPVFRGGPVEQARGFVLHSADYSSESTMQVQEDICLTATLDILKAIADNNGPREKLLVLGYAGWSPGQLEDEIARNGWLTGKASSDILFERQLDQKYDLALKSMGIDEALLSADAGHA
ncbi:MAG: YqgE/AlgH family protein [Pseudomonadota bacterium]